MKFIASKIKVAGSEPTLLHARQKIDVAFNISIQSGFSEPSWLLDSLYGSIFIPFRDHPSVSSAIIRLPEEAVRNSLLNLATYDEDEPSTLERRCLKSIRRILGNGVKVSLEWDLHSARKCSCMMKTLQSI